ncbi:hypothetical protein E2C01_076645 [Portunus trituberculatus]|uniref:Uncharacterized protein n=1 Tax=Portunus trituberculatus TaxID=210409 RepID=A0A5B7II58_PORTR|nr:hypothetical protein [Portunus trituberculatus]
MRSGSGVASRACTEKEKGSEGVTRVLHSSLAVTRKESPKQQQVVSRSNAHDGTRKDGGGREWERCTGNRCPA